jgi:methionyl-tRNA formyltransferase
MRILFMGTPEFAVPCLERLSQSGHEIAGVVTAVDRPKGRGLKRAQSPVKAKAKALGLPVLQPESLKDPALMSRLRALSPELTVIVAFRILPMAIVNLPPMGTINLHASLLPKYRGAAPIPWAIANGEKETGLTVFYLNEIVDGGDIIEQLPVPIGPAETAGELYDRLKVLGAGLLADCVDRIARGDVKTFAQPATGATPAPKIQKAHGKIDFTKSAKEIYNLIRAMTPVPGAFLFYREKRIGVLGASVVPGHGQKTPGTVLACRKDGIHVQTGRGTLSLARFRPEGRNVMTAGDFINGFRTRENDRFG